MIFSFQVVTHEADRRAGAVGDPEIQIAVMVPVHRRHGASVIDQIQSGDRRDVGESCTPRVQKAAIPLVAAQGTPLRQ